MNPTSILKSIEDLISKSYILIIVLFVCGLIFTFSVKGFNLNFRQIFKTLKSSGKKSKDGISGFQSLMLSTASRIGNGNIAGVASAIVVGGPGALFWMWITALIGMATAFMEGVLSQLHKKKWGHTYVGGTPFYIAKGSRKKFFKKFLNYTAIAYTIFAIITFGLPYIGVQSNTISSNFYEVVKPYTSIDPLIFKSIMGVILAAILIAVTIKGVKSIGKFTEIVMPIMGILYLIIAIVIVMMNIEDTGKVWELISKNAFGVKQIIGGVGGYSIIRAINKGVSRGAFSNEAGIGSASFSAASSNSKHPVQQGLLQSLSTFLDTIIICSASGFIILYSGVYSSDIDYLTSNSSVDPKIESSTLIQASIASQMGGEPSKWIVFICVFLFGLTTTVGLYYYSETALKFLSRKKIYQIILKILVCSFIVIFSIVKSGFIWKLEALCTFILVFINVLFMLSQIRVVRNLIIDYKNQIHSGKPITFNYHCDIEEKKSLLIKKQSKQ